MHIEHAIDEFLCYLEVERNRSPKTLEAYGQDLNTFVRFLRKTYVELKHISDLSPSTIRRFIQDQVLVKKVQPATVHRRISCLKSWSRFCLSEHWCETDFAAGISMPKQASKLPRYLSREELKQLFSGLEQAQGPYARRNELLFKLLATTGMRRQEVLDLTWEQIDLEQNTVRVFGKGSKERLLPLHPTIVLPLLTQFRELLPCVPAQRPVFCSRKGNALSPVALHELFKTSLEKTGLPSQHFTLHHLRHTFATLLLYNPGQPCDLRTLQELLGHANLSTTGIYTHVEMANKQKAIASLQV